MSNRFQPLPFGAIKPGDWLKQQLLDDLNHGFASRLDMLTERVSSDLFKDRISTSQSQFAWWDSETRGNWLWGYAMMAFLADDQAHIERVTSLVDDLLATQEDDGYIGIYSETWRYKHPPGENGELWAQGRALLTLLAFYEFTGRDDMLDAVKRAAQLTMTQYGPDNRYYQRGDDLFNGLTGLTHGLNYVDVMAWLYRITDDTAYRDFGVWLYDDFCAMAVPFPNDDIHPTNLAANWLGFRGHAAHTGEHLRVLFWAATMTGREDLLEAVEQATVKLQSFLTPSGALVGDEGVHGLPNPDLGYEYCTMTELLFSLLNGQHLFGKAWYGDASEVLAYNAGQGARMSDGMGIAYLSTDTRLHALNKMPDSYSYIIKEGGRFKFSPTHEDIAVCCNPNAVRFLPHTISNMWLRADDGLVAAVYGASHVHTDVNGVRVRVDTTTHYPFSDEIVLTIHPDAPVEFALYLRQPDWVQDMTVMSDGAEATTQDGYHVVRKTWQPDDGVRITFQNAIRFLPYPNGEYSVHYGALQFVQTIDHDLTAIKSYPVEGFHDYDVTPVDLRTAHTPLILDGAEPDFGLKAIDDGDDFDHPWHTSPIQLTDGSNTLVPLGTTLLRRASFPVDIAQSNDSE